ncbi:MAG: penicillin-binding protein 2 [Coxiella sp. (in: Bacteria)]|nr:MAG: penicillin-binding protein 2 [Coxiella sp. (in: g-proteobacteria)]
MLHHTIKNHHQEARLFATRSIVVFLFILIFVAAIVSRLIYLQVVKHETYSTLSIHNLLKIIPTEASRGLIYDRNGVLLAKNVPVFSLDITPGEVKNVDATVNALGEIITLAPTDITAFKQALTRHRKYEPIPLKYKLTEDELDQFYLNQYRFPGVTVQANMLRQYPLGNIMGNVIGYAGRINAKELAHVDPVNYRPSDYIGKTGIEKYYETTLHGHVGSALSEINASGEVLRNLKNIPGTPGKNLYLTIDSKLQAYAEKVLGNNNGAIVAIQPSTGQILALVTKPTFNPNPFVMGISTKQYHALITDPNHPLYDRAIRGLYSPGSTIKPFQSLAGLYFKTITPQYTILDPGWYRVPHTKHIFHDDRWGGHGHVNLHKAIKVSCDTYFYNLAVKLGIKHIDDFLPMFGFGQPTDVEMPDELSGVLPTPAWKRHHKGYPWYTGDTVNMGIGQGMFTVTPLQLASATAIIAEHGQHLQPHLTLRWQNPDNSVTLQPNTQLAPIDLDNKSYWNTVISGMEAVIDGGTARRYGAHPGYRVAGKTGTAQVYGTYRDEETTDWKRPKLLRNNHLFIDFAPVKNPQIVIAVVVEHATYADTFAGKVTRYYLHELKQTKKKTHAKTHTT